MDVTTCLTNLECTTKYAPGLTIYIALLYIYSSTIKSVFNVINIRIRKKNSEDVDKVLDKLARFLVDKAIEEIQKEKLISSKTR